MKKCERCGEPIPPEYINSLCDECYKLTVNENEQRKQETETQRASEVLKNPSSPIHPDNIAMAEPVGEKQEKTAEEPVVEAPGQLTCDHSECGIQDKDYVENPEQDDKDQILANLAQFVYSSVKDPKRGKLLWYPQRNMYTFIKNYCMKKAMSHPQYPKYIWKPKIVDVGCGSGVGANIMSLEADMVWGIDKNELSIQFAKEAFTREKNGEYYSSQLTFDVIDVMHDNRQFMTFDIVVAIEIIEHIWDVNGFLNQLKRFTKKDKKGLVIKDRNQATEFFISSPNRNFIKIRKDRPENLFHVREWRSQELHSLLKKHFEEVELMNQKGEPIEIENSADQVIFAKCRHPI